jgi:hypothetical protein
MGGGHRAALAAQVGDGGLHIDVAIEGRHLRSRPRASGKLLPCHEQYG